jgi:hypothetical protein
VGHIRVLAAIIFTIDRKTHMAPKTALKTRLCDRFNLPDWQNKAYLRLFLNGALYGLLLDEETGNLRPD